MKLGDVKKDRLSIILQWYGEGKTDSSEKGLQLLDFFLELLDISNYWVVAGGLNL